MLMSTLRVRTIFYAHAAVAIYCLACGLLDGCGHFQPWMIPNVFTLYGLALSALLFPLVAGLSLKGTGVTRPFRILAAHVGISAIQVYFGLLPLVA